MPEPHPPNRGPDTEATIKRNPHPEFAKVEASRPRWDEDAHFRFTQTRRPSWQLGDGATDGGESLRKEHVAIDPYEEGRPTAFNYKLLISAVLPRPIGFVSTRSEDGTSTNLSPFSYFSLINHEPPLFTLGFASGLAAPKDTLRNLAATGECTLNIVSEHFLEAANATAIDAPHGQSEWLISGLHPAPCEVVKPSRVQEAVFSVEGKVLSTQEFESKIRKGERTGTLVVVEGVRFWAREDAVNEERSLVDPGVLRAVGRLGGITYMRPGDGVEIPRWKWEENVESAEANGLVGRHGGDI